jgi:outer membrane murein-binding lipoprotein Lpp
MIMRLGAAVVAGMIASAGLWAQDKKVQDPAQSKELNIEAYVELLREDVQAKRLDVIKEGMQLDEKQAAAFWPVYDEYAGEQKKLGDQKLAIIQDYAKDFMSMDDAKADELAQRVMALDEQRTALRKKYYQAMKKVLPTVLVVRFFQLDNQVQMLIDLQIASNLPIIEESPTKQ